MLLWNYSIFSCFRQGLMDKWGERDCRCWYFCKTITMLWLFIFIRYTHNDFALKNIKLNRKLALVSLYVCALSVSVCRSSNFCNRGASVKTFSFKFKLYLNKVILKENKVGKAPIWPYGSASSAVVSLITPGTMGHLFQYSSEGNIFTTQRSRKKAAVSKDFGLCLPFFSLFPFYLHDFDVAKHQSKQACLKIYFREERHPRIYSIPHCWMKPLSI